MIEFNRDMSYVKSPCYECKRRKITEDENGNIRTCHSYCSDYNEFREKVKAFMKKKSMEDERYVISDTKKKWLLRKKRTNLRKDSTKY